MSVHRRIETRQVNSNAGEVTVVRFVDRKIIEPSQIEELGSELASLVEDEGRKFILIDFARVEFLSSAALNKLINVHNKLTPLGGKLKMCNLRRELEEVFVITRLNRLLDIRTDEAKALESF